MKKQTWLDRLLNRCPDCHEVYWPNKEYAKQHWDCFCEMNPNKIINPCRFCWEVPATVGQLACVPCAKEISNFQRRNEEI